MKYSENFSFFLPESSDSANIEQISENFRNIDENALKKETGASTKKRVYAIEEDGNQGIIPVNATDEIIPNALVMTDKFGYSNIYIRQEPASWDSPVSKDYVHRTFLQKVGRDDGFPAVYADDGYGTPTFYPAYYMAPESIRLGEHVVMSNENGQVSVAETPESETDATSKYYVDSLLGDIDLVLDEIIALQNELIGGGTV